jgi:TolA-binding protein
MDNIKTPNMEVTGLDELSKKLDRLQAKDSQMEEQIVKIIKQALKDARKLVQSDAATALKGKDPRHAAKAVRTMIYKQILGGNINILRKRKAGSGKSADPPKGVAPAVSKKLPATTKPPAARTGAVPVKKPPKLAGRVVPAAPPPVVKPPLIVPGTPPDKPNAEESS